jgi:hypothetical protein
MWIRDKGVSEKYRKTSQRKLADMLQTAGLDIDKNAVQRIESGKAALNGKHWKRRWA